MKKITLKQLRLLNFKGTRDKTINFSQTTDVFGANKSGKTTLFDAFLWLLFGKDSTDRKDFEIKTLDSNNEAFHKMTHEVTAVIVVDGDEVTIRRSYKENWPTKKGTATETFSGHTNSFFWNDVPLNETEYKKKIAAITDESLFKLITNTSYFNALKWQERRIVLENIAGTITSDMVAASLPGIDLTKVITAITAGKSLQEYKNEISAKKKIIRDEKDLLPSRIDEARRSMPEYVDYTATEGLLVNAKGALQEAENQIADKNLALKDQQEAKSGLMNRVHALSTQAREIEFTERQKVQDRKRERDTGISHLANTISMKENDLRRIDSDLLSDQGKKTLLESQQQELRSKWSAINDEQLNFKPNEFSCPACKREFDADKIESKKTELTQNFNADKSRRLAEVTTSGQQLAQKVADIMASITNLSTAKQNLEASIGAMRDQLRQKKEDHIRLSANDDASYNDALAAHADYNNIAQQIKELNEEIALPIAAVDTAELQNKKQQLQQTIDSYNSTLASKGQKERIEARITELQDQEAAQAQELAELEGTEFSILQYEKAKMDLLENTVNGMFTIVKFKMFEKNINGGESPCCETLVNGVPFADVNTAGKIQAGLDIINTLCRFHNISAPVFIDNRESVTDIPAIESQVINLIVSAPDTDLRILPAA